MAVGEQVTSDLGADPVSFLARSVFLSGVDEAELRSIDPPPEWVTLQTGETLIHQGMPGEAFYLLVHGRMRAFVTAVDGTRQLVGEIVPGDEVGEMSLLTDQPTAAEVRARHDCLLIRFPRETYLHLVQTYPQAGLHVARTAIRRLQVGMGVKKHSLPWPVITLLPVAPGLNLTDLVNGLSTALEPFGSVNCIGRDSVPDDLAPSMQGTQRLNPEADHDLTEQLSDHEHSHDITLYVGDLQPNEWNRIAIRQADLVLLVSHVDLEPELTSMEETYLATLDPELAPKIDLVLLHPGAWRDNCGTRRWLEPRTVAEHHHLRTGAKGDLERLARIVTGNSVGLVLGGGGARGFSQIGVVRALREAGIPVDRVGGTSIGSAIGAQVAANMSIDEMYRMNRRLWIEGKPLNDYTFPAIAVMRGRKLHNLMRAEFGEVEIEDLPVNYFCVSTNLSESKIMLHDRGQLWSSVRASGSIPGAFSPLFLNGKLLVDGAVLNNLPGDIMWDRFGGIVITVDVARPRNINVPDTLDDVPSGWQILWRKVNPFAKPLQVPTLFEILYRTATLSSGRLARDVAARADVLFTPPVHDYAIDDFEKIDEIISIGHRHAVDVLRTQTTGRLPDLLARLGRTPLSEFEGSVLEIPEASSGGSERLLSRSVIAIAGIVLLAIGVFIGLGV